MEDRGPGGDESSQDREGDTLGRLQRVGDADQGDERSDAAEGREVVSDELHGKDAAQPRLTDACCWLPVTTAALTRDTYWDTRIAFAPTAVASASWTDALWSRATLGSSMTRLPLTSKPFV